MKKIILTSLLTMGLLAGPLCAAAQSSDNVDSNLTYLVLEARLGTSSASALTPPESTSTSRIVAPPLPASTTPQKPATPSFFVRPASFLAPTPAPAPAVEATSSASSTPTLPATTSATTTPRAPSTTPPLLLPITKDPAATSTKVLGITLPAFSFGAPNSSVYRTNHLSTEETEYLLALAAALGIVGMVFVGSNALNRLIVRRPAIKRSPRFRS